MHDPVRLRLPCHLDEAWLGWQVVIMIIKCKTFFPPTLPLLNTYTILIPRNNDLPITTGTRLILTDPRFNVELDKETSTFILRIRDIQETDGATYQCQVRCLWWSLPWGGEGGSEVYVCSTHWVLKNLNLLTLSHFRFWLPSPTKLRLMFLWLFDVHPLYPTTPQGGDSDGGGGDDGGGDDGDHNLLRSVVALEGRRVELRCYASGYPPPGELFPQDQDPS